MNTFDRMPPGRPFSNRGLRGQNLSVVDERAVVPIGVFNPKFGVTLSMPGILGRAGVSRILEPAMTEEELQGLERSADRLRAASKRIGALVDV